MSDLATALIVSGTLAVIMTAYIVAVLLSSPRSKRPVPPVEWARPPEWHKG